MDMSGGRNYTKYNVQREREFHSGEYGMPTANGPPVTVKLHGPIEFCLVSYEGGCRESWPVVPHPQSVVNEGMVLTESKETTVFPQFNGKTREYITFGYYFFTNLYPTGPATDLAAGVQDGDILERSSAILRAANYQMGVLSNKYLDADSVALENMIESGLPSSAPLSTGVTSGTLPFSSGVIFPPPPP